MYEFKLEFLNNMCKWSLFKYKTLQDAFQNYLKETKVILDDSYNYYNPEFEKLLKNYYIFPPEADEKKDFDFGTYPKLEQLLEYIYHIFYLAEKQTIYLKNGLLDSENPLTHYMFSESRIAKIILDRRKHECFIEYAGVTEYLNGDVNIADVTVHYKETQTFEMEGNLNITTADTYSIAQGYIAKTPEGLYYHSLLCNGDPGYCIIKIIFSEAIMDIKRRPNRYTIV